MLKRYGTESYPSEFPVRSKCIGLFQKIHGVDTLLFAMYVYEYGHDCPAPNKRRVYISYLDSVQYFEPKCYRTIAYQAIMIEYLRYVKKRGFHTAAMWSCPPVGGDDYIFYCHPKHQLVPQEDMLRSWYHKMLDQAKNQGVVLRTTTLYDEYFSSDAVDQIPGQRRDPTCLPYFEGDYIPGEIENIIQQLEAKGDVAEHTSSLQDNVMARLGHSIQKMKDNFIVVHLRNRRFAAAVERGEDVSNWKEDSDDDMLRSKRAKISGKCPAEPDSPEKVNGQHGGSAQGAEVSQHPGGTTVNTEEKRRFDEKGAVVASDSLRLVEFERRSEMEGSSERSKHVDEDAERTSSLAACCVATENPSQSSVVADTKAGELGIVDSTEPSEIQSENRGVEPVQTQQTDVSKPLSAINPDGQRSEESRVADPAGLSTKGELNSAVRDSAAETKLNMEETTQKIKEAAQEGTEQNTLHETGSNPDSKIDPSSVNEAGDASSDNTGRAAETGSNVDDASARALTPSDPSDSLVQKRVLDEIKPAISQHMSSLQCSSTIVGDTSDDDPPMESEMFESRQQFLNYCQTTHCQFDDLRRAKHSTVMVLFQLHNPMAPKFLQQCGACYRDITHGIYYHCNDCSSFDLCEECHEPVTSGLWAKKDPRFAHDKDHSFTAVDMEGDEETQKNQGESRKSLKAHIELLEHAGSCPGSPGCAILNCERMKRLFNHVTSCDVTPKKDCKVCTRLFALCTMHSRMCTVRITCPIPFCDRIRERNKRLRRQQQQMDDRRRQAQNELYHAGSKV
jgi:Histone acetylation protein/TAZ zinc finger